MRADRSAELRENQYSGKQWMLSLRMDAREQANSRRYTIERAAVQGQSDGASNSRPNQAPHTAKMMANAMSARLASLRLVTAFRCCH